MPLICFDLPQIYYLTQYAPVYRALTARGAQCRFMVYRQADDRADYAHRVIERLDLPAVWVDSSPAAAEIYRETRPDWVVFGNVFEPLAELPAVTRSAQLYHGIGMKADIYTDGLFAMDVRFTEGPHYTQALKARFPQASLVEVGYAKIDPLFWPASEQPRFDLRGAGLDPDRSTLMYAPTFFPSSLGAMPRDWPARFRDYNLIVKCHQFTYFNRGRYYRAQRRRLARWAEADNVYLVPAADYDPIPYMAVADLLISDASSVLFEFAATDKPVVWCDFFKLRLSYWGPLRYRLERRLDQAIERYADIAAHAGHYSELQAAVEAELKQPQRHAAKRREYTETLLGPTDGRTGERIADYLLRKLR